MLQTHHDIPSHVNKAQVLTMAYKPSHHSAPWLLWLPSPMLFLCSCYNVCLTLLQHPASGPLHLLFPFPGIIVTHLTSLHLSSLSQRRSSSFCFWRASPALHLPCFTAYQMSLHSQQDPSLTLSPTRRWAAGGQVLLFFLVSRTWESAWYRVGAPEVFTGCVDALRPGAAPCLPRPHVEVPATSQRGHLQSCLRLGFLSHKTQRVEPGFLSPCHRIEPRNFRYCGHLGKEHCPPWDSWKPSLWDGQVRGPTSEAQALPHWPSEEKSGWVTLMGVELTADTHAPQNPPTLELALQIPAAEWEASLGGCWEAAGNGRGEKELG